MTAALGRVASIWSFSGIGGMGTGGTERRAFLAVFSVPGFTCVLDRFLHVGEPSVDAGTGGDELLPSLGPSMTWVSAFCDEDTLLPRNMR